MARRIAGRAPIERDDALRVDYADVLAQAVANERIKVLREVERILANEPTNEYDRSAYSAGNIPADAYKRRVEASIRRLWPDE